jgi:hypothetical protein
MKKFLLSAIVIMSACQLKAQQLKWFKPLDTLANNFDNFSKLKPATKFQLFAPHTNINKNLMAPFLNANVSKVDNMPIVALAGYDKMPVAKLAGYYTMPVKHIVTDGRGAPQQNILPGLPTFKTP